MIQAFLFDLDGTLIDSEILWADVLHELLAKKGCPLTHRDALEIVYGKSWNDVHAEVNDRCDNLYPNFSRLKNDMHDIFARLVRSRDIVIHNSVTLLRRLARRFPVGIVTGSFRSDLEDALDRLRIRDCLRFAISYEDYPSAKPDPACFRLAAERLQLPCDRCLAFEDSTAGIQAAKSAGMACVALQRPDRPPQNVSLADQVLEDLALFDLNRWTAAGH